ncbi:UPF0450 protein C17orf58-like [Schistocerca piceifrons]|uniref:UPF0450 protein C17orf58-like n=1 Tax=Schistocerca piceifrons TaxID=274613 RepID=UPI001F5F6413|nr:UPF0450 protein C17orf58-like [Schistocerca piceifrons]
MAPTSDTSGLERPSTRPAGRGTGAGGGGEETEAPGLAGRERCVSERLPPPLAGRRGPRLASPRLASPRLARRHPAARSAPARVFGVGAVGAQRARPPLASVCGSRAARAHPRRDAAAAAAGLAAAVPPLSAMPSTAAARRLRALPSPTQPEPRLTTQPRD